MDIKSLLMLIIGLLQLQVNYLKALPEVMDEFANYQKYKSILEKYSDLFDKAISKHVVEYIQKTYSLLELPSPSKSIDELKLEIKDLIKEKEEQLAIKIYMFGNTETRISNVENIVPLTRNMKLLEQDNYLQYFDLCYNYFQHINAEIMRNMKAFFVNQNLIVNCV